MPSATYEKQWLVQKYGGTSIGKFLQNITGEIVPKYLEGYKVALVCSAISGIEKETGTTSLLSTAMTLAMNGSWAGVENAIRSIREDHFGMLEGIYKSNQLSDAFDNAKGEIAEELNIVQELLYDIQVWSPFWYRDSH
jgi:aspartokinase